LAQAGGSLQDICAHTSADTPAPALATTSADQLCNCGWRRQLSPGGRGARGPDTLSPRRRRFASHTPLRSHLQPPTSHLPTLSNSLLSTSTCSSTTTSTSASIWRIRYIRGAGVLPLRRPTSCHGAGMVVPATPRWHHHAGTTTPAPPCRHHHAGTTTPTPNTCSIRVSRCRHHATLRAHLPRHLHRRHQITNNNT